MTAASLRHGENDEISAGIAPGKIEFIDVLTPETEANQILIKIKRIGICGSDIHVYHGKHPYTSYSVLQGHEVSGEIERVEARVKGLKKGDRVTIQPQAVCGRCYPCSHGKYHICDNLKVMGFQTTGAASEYFAVDADKLLLKLPDGMSFEHGAMVEPLAVAVHPLGRHGDVVGEKILVFGAGPIGNLVAQAAKAMGAEKVMITDISDYRVKLAEECVIDYVVDNVQMDLGKEILVNYGKKKADLILECVGINLGLVQDREIRLIGTLMYQERDFRKAIELIAQKKILLDPLITDHFALLSIRPDHPMAGDDYR